MKINYCDIKNIKNIFYCKAGDVVTRDSLYEVFGETRNSTGWVRFICEKRKVAGRFFMRVINIYNSCMFLKTILYCM